MHGLSVIVSRNARAAGREAAAAFRDGDYRLANRISSTFDPPATALDWCPYYAGYEAQRRDDDAQYGKYL